MLRRSSVYLLSTILVVALLVGCADQGQQTGPAGDGAAKTGTDVKVQVPQSIQESPATPPPAANTGVSPTAGTPAAAPTTAATRAEPQGRVTYLWHTAITPAWFDPQENPALVTPYGFQYALHDALVKPMPGNPFTPSLGESYQIADDFRSATFKLREGIKFHNGEPVTAEDVKFTFENYRGANAQILHGKVERIETPDARTVRFVFNEPFLDFLILYGSPASGAGWIVPKAYYEQVGPDGFKQKPIGAGPYKFVRQSGGTEFEFEAFTDYWRKTPHIKTLIIRSVSEDSTRIAQVQTREADLMNLVPGPLIDVVRQDPNLQLAPVLGGPMWLEFPGFEDPASPYHDPRVRQAISLALDRQAISAAEEGGFSGFEGNWIPQDWPGAINRPRPEFNLQRAQQLMADAGVPNGFDGGSVTPLPPYFSLAERVITSLRQIGIELRLNQMERGAFAARLAEGPGAFPPGMLLPVSGAPGDAASRIRSYAICPPQGASSRTCDPQIDQKFARYEASSNPQEREQLLREIQEYILDNFIFVPIYRQAFINVKGPRVANEWTEIFGAVPQYVYVGPYEDVRLSQ